MLGWCKALPHATQDHGDESVATVSMDYCFLTADDESRPQDHSVCVVPDEVGVVSDDPAVMRRHKATTLVLKDRGSRAVLSHVVPRKGADPYAVRRVLDDLRWLGYKRLNLKSDSEASIVELKRVAQDAFKGEIVPEESPVADSSSNGEVENAIQLAEGHKPELCILRSVRDTV